MLTTRSSIPLALLLAFCPAATRCRPCADRGRLLSPHALRSAGGGRPRSLRVPTDAGRPHGSSITARRTLDDHRPLRRRDQSEPVPPLCPGAARSAGPRRARRLAVRRPSGSDVSRLKDTDGDGSADVFEIVSDGWDINGDYHEYAFGSQVRQRRQHLGRALPDRLVRQQLQVPRLVPADHARRQSDSRPRSGIRSPGGIGINRAGRHVLHRQPRPLERRLRSQASAARQVRRAIPAASSGTTNAPSGDGPQAQRAEERQPHDGRSRRRFRSSSRRPCYFPYPKMGQSASGIVCDTTGGKFGPFADSCSSATRPHSTVMRVLLEKVNGHYQGACFPFREGFGSGTLALVMTPRTARCSSAAPTAAGARAARSPSRRTPATGPARCRSKSTRCTPSPTALS